MHTEHLHFSIQTIDIPGRRRWLIWGERSREIHLQSFYPQRSLNGNHRTLCGRDSEPDSRIVIAPDNHICRDCVRAARTHSPLH